MSQWASVRAISLAVLVVAAAGCQGGSAAKTNPVETATEEAGLSKIVEAFKKFHDDTGAWPMGASAWNVANTSDPQIDPIAFDEHDTALFTLPAGVSQCSSVVAKPCWNGPYLTGKSLGDATYKDAWGHARLVTIIRPFNGSGGGVQSQPDGAVIVWSQGADGLDSLGCSDASCARNWNLLAKGEPSGTKSDDIITVVGKTSASN